MFEFYAWCEGISALTKVKLGHVIDYVLCQRKSMADVLLDGNLEPLNNRSERAVKDIIIIQKIGCFRQGSKIPAQV